MCDRCLPTRRELLKLSALTAAALGLAGCPPAPRTELPNPYEADLEGEGTRPTIETQVLPLPPPTPPQKTVYGDIMPRRAWTGSPLAIPHWRLMDGVSRLTVHHSGDGKPFLATSVPDTIRHLQIVREAHLRRGMVDIAYHFAVDRAGRVWQLRSLRYEGQHVRPSKDRRIFWNEHNIGIVTLGDFNLQYPTPEQVNRLIAFVHLVRGKYALPLSRVCLHRELVQTDCPGKHLAPLVIQARQRGAA
ncbi:MAG: peptidoglycan recognition protein family protein [Phycisphaerae bacterium]